MSKASTRPITPIRRRREPTAGEGGGIDLVRCGPRVVTISSDRTASELRAMRVAYLEVNGRDVVIRRSGVTAALVTGDAELRRCIEQDGVRFEADLARLTERGGLRVPVRPLRPR